MPNSTDPHLPRKAVPPLQSGGFPGQVAIVTGAAQGIGAAIARAFVTAGARVLAVDIDPAVHALALPVDLPREAELLTWQCDVTSTDQLHDMVSATIDRWRRIDILITAAGGFGQWQALAEVSDAEWERMIALNLSSVFRSARAVLPIMRRQGHGRLIFIASQAGVTPNPYAASYTPYGTAKAGVLGLTRLLAREVGPDGITVNAISPGTTATERVLALRGAESLHEIAQQNPLRCLIEPEDCAQAALYLASPAGRHITGINLNLNAGSVMV